MKIKKKVLSYKNYVKYIKEHPNWEDKMETPESKPIIARPDYRAKYRCGHCGIITKVQNEIYSHSQLQCAICNKPMKRTDRIYQINDRNR